MAFSPIKRLKIADQVAAALRDAILTGSFQPGDPLPSERALADDFDVNRSSVREALQRLESWGLVAVRQGGGTRVRDFVSTAGLQLLPFLLAPGGQPDPSLFSDLFSLRTALLGWTAGLAAEHRTDEAVARLLGVVAELRGATTVADLQRLDFDFFQVLVEMSDNQVLALIANGSRAVFDHHSELFAGLYGAATFDKALLEAAAEAIVASDATAASSAMTAHGRATERAWSTHFGQE